MRDFSKLAGEFDSPFHGHRDTILRLFCCHGVAVDVGGKKRKLVNSE